MRTEKIGTGIKGLDQILFGGIPADNIYLVAGSPGTGKTTLALQFLLEGLRHDEAGLYITLSQTKRELIAVAASHGLTLNDVVISDRISADLSGDRQTVFHPSDVDLGKITAALLAEVTRVGPQRVVIDSVSDLRLLAEDSLRFRREILALKQFFDSRESTVFLLDDYSSSATEPELEGLVHGVITLKCSNPEYGPSRRQLRVSKMRGANFSGGHHDFSIEAGGLVVYPRLEVGTRGLVKGQTFLAGVEGLDELIGGGLDPSTSALIIGPAGVGKSTLAAQYVDSAGDNGRKAAYFTFDEGRETMLLRTAGLGMKLGDHISAGRLRLQQVNPDEMSPGAFSDRVRQSVEDDHAQVVVIDSLNGYHQAMSDARFLNAHVNDLLAYLSQHGILAILVVGQHGLFGSATDTSIDLSYMADTVILLRYFESNGEVRQAISVSKKRSGSHEHSIRELKLSSSGVFVGKTLRGFQGILTGVPHYLGDSGRMDGGKLAS